MKEAEKVAKLCVCGKVALNISCFSLSPKMDDKNEVDNARAVAAFFYFFWYHTHTHSILLREWKEIHISDYLKNRPTRKKKSVVFITLVVTRHTITFLFLNYKKKSSKVERIRVNAGPRGFPLPSIQSISSTILITIHVSNRLIARKKWHSLEVACVSYPTCYQPWGYLRPSISESRRRFEHLVGLPASQPAGSPASL